MKKEKRKTAGNQFQTNPFPTTMKKPKPKKVYRYMHEIVAGREERERRKKLKKLPTHAQRMNGGFVPALCLTIVSEVTVFVVVLVGGGVLNSSGVHIARSTAI